MDPLLDAILPGALASFCAWLLCRAWAHGDLRTAWTGGYGRVRYWRPLAVVLVASNLAAIAVNGYMALAALAGLF